MNLDSWRRAADWVIYIAATLLLAGAVASIWIGDVRWVGMAGAFVVVLAVVIALTEDKRGTGI